MPRKQRTKARLKYPKHAAFLKPTDLLHFMYEDGFLQDCADIDLNEDDIEAIEIVIMAGGKNSAIIPGTGGLRKLRFSPAQWSIGKSGAARILFVFFEDISSILLVGAYRKSEYDNISDAAKSLYRKLIAKAEAEIKRRGRLC